MEHKILSAIIHSREAFDELVTHDVEHDFSDKGKILYDEIKEYYALDVGATNCDKDILLARIERKYPKHMEAFKVVLAGMSASISAPNILQEVIELKKHNVKLKLSAAFAAGKENEIETLLEEYAKYKRNEIADNGADVYVGTSVADLLAGTDSTNRIAVLPAALNEVLEGGAKRKHHIIVFARPETGKTLFVLNMLYGFVKQGLRVLYVGNEDPISDIITRFLWRLTGMDKYAFNGNLDEADKLARERGYENVVFAEMAPGTIPEIRSLIEEYKPDVLIVDQLHNLNVGEQNPVIQRTKAASAIRNLGKEYNMLCVSTTQAGDSGDGKAVLDMGDIDFSNTGIPAQADLLIGIGMNEEMEKQGLRMLSLPKNKVSGSKEVVSVLFNRLQTKVE